MKLFQLGSKDLLKGFIMAVLTVIASGLYSALSATPVHFPTLSELQTTGLMGLSAGILYLIKNFFTNSDDQFMKSEK